MSEHKNSNSWTLALVALGVVFGDIGTSPLYAVKATLGIAIPFQLQGDPDGAATGFLQYYAYMISMVDRHILRVLETLEASGLREDTIVVFSSDHGEYGAAHGMQIEKWHGAYQEAVHVPLLISSTRFNEQRNAQRVIASQTSHIDILPTLLKLAHATDEQIDRARRNLSKTHAAATLPGANLVPVIEAGGGPVTGPDGHERKGVLFATDDMIKNLKTQLEAFRERVKTAPAGFSELEIYTTRPDTLFGASFMAVLRRRKAGRARSSYRSVAAVG